MLSGRPLGLDVNSDKIPVVLHSGLQDMKGEAPSPWCRTQICWQAGGHATNKHIRPMSNPVA